LRYETYCPIRKKVPRMFDKFMNIVVAVLSVLGLAVVGIAFIEMIMR
jgi:hypothetical protein